MRNRVAHDAVHGLVRTAAVLALLPTALILVAAGSAGADPVSGVPEERLSFGLGGVVGIVAVILGVGGLLLGLLRRRRVRTTPPAPAVEPARTETPV